jgi:hypothetical protein
MPCLFYFPSLLWVKAHPPVYAALVMIYGMAAIIGVTVPYRACPKSLVLMMIAIEIG